MIFSNKTEGYLTDLEVITETQTKVNQVRLHEKIILHGSHQVAGESWKGIFLNPFQKNFAK